MNMANRDMPTEVGRGDVVAALTRGVGKSTWLTIVDGEWRKDPEWGSVEEFICDPTVATRSDERLVRAWKDMRRVWSAVYGPLPNPDAQAREGTADPVADD